LQFRDHTLDNGMEVIAECNDRAYTTSLAFFVKTGARDETDKTWGVSHFLEHMAFKGTPTRSAADVNRELDEMGSQSNAFTSEEQTVYYATVLPENQQKALYLLADIMRPALRVEDFETEKQVIIEEIYKYEDQPPFGSHEKCMAAYFGSHPLARSVLGTVESVGSLTPDAMRSYFQQRYSPRNIVLAAAGNVDFDQLVEHARRSCGWWEPFDAPRPTPQARPHCRFLVVHKEQAVQEYVTQISAGPAADDPDRYAMRVLATVLGDDSGSRLFWALVDTGLAEYATMACYEFQGCGILMTYLCCAPDQTAANLQRTLDIEREAQRSGITADELQLAKSKICSQVVLRSERPANRLFAVGMNWIQRHTYQTVKEAVQAYQAVQLDDIARALGKYPLERTATVSAGPLKELAEPR
jgi:predicted Zn-dependent peptidase